MDFILSARVSANAEVFRDVLALHVSPGAVVADVTYGRGCFWNLVNESDYRLLKSDLATGTDFRSLPYEDGSVDALVLDPPYTSGFFRPRGVNALVGHSDFHDRYAPPAGDQPLSHHDAVIALYRGGIREAARVLRAAGLLILKCQDEVTNHRQHFTHVELINFASSLGFSPRDLFVVVRRDTPTSPRRTRHQYHARKNHSYFVVMAKGESRPLTVRTGAVQ